MTLSCLLGMATLPQACWTTICNGWMDRVMTREDWGAILGNAHFSAAHADLQARDLFYRNFSAIKSCHAPMQVFLQIRLHIGRIQTRESPSYDVLQQGGCQWNCSGNDEITCAIRFALAALRIWRSAQNGEATDGVILEWPGFRIRVEVPKEHDDTERLTEAMLDRSEVGDPLGIFVVGHDVRERLGDH